MGRGEIKEGERENLRAGAGKLKGGEVEIKRGRGRI